MKKKLYLDFDCTIVNTLKAITDMYNEDFKWYKKFKYINWWDVNTWDFLECDCATPEYINMYFNQPRFYEKLEYMDNAEEVLNRLKDEYEITIISMGYNPNIRGKAIWINEHVPYAKFIGVNFKEYENKEHIDMSDGYYFDDNEKNLHTNAIENICFGDVYSWNENWQGRRCHNWYDVERFLKGVK